MTDKTGYMGRVTRCSTRGFVGALRLPEPDLPVFGAFCSAEAQGGQSEVIGLIYDISIPDDEFARQMAAADQVSEELLADGQVNRQVPVEFSALAVGQRAHGVYAQGLPPQPPLTLAPVRPMSDEAVRDFSEALDFLTLVLGAPQVPAEDLAVACLVQAARVRPPAQRRQYLTQAGRACARLLEHDLPRLERILTRLDPRRTQ